MSGINDATAGGETSEKEELRRRMEQSREAITGTVGEIKDVVARQYEEVRGRVETAREAAVEALGWREQFDRNPLIWGAGAVSVGILIGLGLARALEDEDGRRADSVAGRAAGELTALAEAVLPAVSAQVRELFGLDLEEYLRESRRPRDSDQSVRDERSGAASASLRSVADGARASEKTVVKKGGAKKAAAKKRVAKKGKAKAQPSAGGRATARRAGTGRTSG